MGNLNETGRGVVASVSNGLETSYANGYANGFEAAKDRLNERVGRIDYSSLIAGREIHYTAVFNKDVVSEEEAIRWITALGAHDYHPHIAVMYTDQYEEIFGGVFCDENG